MLKKTQKDAWEEISTLFCGCHEWMDLGKYMNIPGREFYSDTVILLEIHSKKSTCYIMKIWNDCISSTINKSVMLFSNYPLLYQIQKRSMYST